MKIITVTNIKQLIKKVTLKTFFLQLIDRLDADYARWNEFHTSPRHATQYPHGIIELMPTADNEYYSFKYVNGHPENTRLKKQTVVATGQLSLVATGYPILLSEMTLLTAMRTAATSALVSKYMAKKNAKTFGIIGTGAQSEFQVLAHHFALGLHEIFYYDLDEHAMDKFAKNLAPYPLKLHRCKSGHDVVNQCDILTTATAQKGHQQVVKAEWVRPGMHINKIGGDSPGKTELDPKLVEIAKVVVELLEQTKHEGEIQQLKAKTIYASLWELAAKKKKGRETENEITLFDSVGFALEDYSTLRLVFDLAEKEKIGYDLDMIPHTPDPKNLFGALQ